MITSIKAIEEAISNIFVKNKYIAYSMANDLASSLVDLYDDYHDTEMPDLVEMKEEMVSFARRLREEGSASKWK